MPGAATAPSPTDLLLRESMRHAILVPAGGGSFKLVESNDQGDGVFNDDGTFNAVLLRPCVGRGPAGVGNGPGRRIYTRELLESLAGDTTFDGWPSYMNHESPVARRARMGLPRPPSELACQIVETSFNPDLTGNEDATFGYQPGALVGRLKPATSLVEDIVRRVPALVKFSLMATATNLTPGRPPWGGEEGMLVEGVVDDPETSSIDMVTTAGAGGVVRSLIESHYSEGHDGDAEVLDLLRDVPDEKLAAHLREHRPNLDLTETGGDELDMAGKTLVEVLQSDEVGTFFRGIVEAVLDERGVEGGSGGDDAKRENAQRALARKAKGLIEAAKLPQVSTEDLLARYAAEDQEDGSLKIGPSLSLVEAVQDSDGNVTKTAGQVLEERLTEEVGLERRKLAEARPTIPIAPVAAGGDGEGSGASAAAQFGGQGSTWGDFARERGIDVGRFGAKTQKPEGATA